MPATEKESLAQGNCLVLDELNSFATKANAFVVFITYRYLDFSLVSAVSTSMRAAYLSYFKAGKEENFFAALACL